jgi:type I restriction enzyme M protein
VIDKEDAHARKGIFIIDASRGFMKDGPKNRLRSQDIHKMVDTFNRRLQIPKYSRMVSFEEIEKNEFNLNLPRYIDSQPEEDIQDIEGHLKGGIPVRDIDALQKYWDVCPKLREALFRDNRPGYLDLSVDKSAIRSKLYDHLEFVAFVAGMKAHFAEWRDKAAKVLRQFKVGCHPKDLIARLSEDLLVHYMNKPLIDAYDVYQHIMDYWDETMQDDCYLVAADEWEATTYLVMETKKNKDGKTVKEIVKGWACDLVPKSLIVARYFTQEQAVIDTLNAELEAIGAQKQELEEDNSCEEGAFADIDKINRRNVAARLEEINGDAEARDEAHVLRKWLELSDQEAECKKKLKDAEEVLDARVYAQYPKLSEAEIQSVVIDDKWLGALEAIIHGEIERISRSLTHRVGELAERYERPLPDHVCAVAQIEQRVNRHLQKMGFYWQ